MPAGEIDPAAAVEAIRRLYAQPPATGVASGRVVVQSDSARLRALAGVDGAIMGAKLHAQGSDGNSTFLIALFDAGGAQLLALLDGRSVTAARTAATSAVAVDQLAPPGRIRVGVLGSGMEARAHLRTLATVRSFETVRVYSPTAARREAFAAEIGGDAVADARSAVQDASVVVCAARSRGEAPIIDGSWLRDDAVVVSIGSTVPEQRELDVSTIARAAVIVADEPEEVLTRSGDCIAATAAGVDVAARLVPLGTPVAADGIRLFKSVGSALQDVAVAQLLYERHDGLPLPIRLTGKERRG